MTTAEAFEELDLSDGREATVSVVKFAYQSR